MMIDQHPQHTSKTKSKRLRWLILTLMSLFILAGLGISSLIIISSTEIPEFETIADYHPKLVSEIYSHDNTLIAELFLERRFVLPFHEIPELLIQAFLASEDDRFYEHRGIDPYGIFRAAVANLKAGKIVQGGSTITQQVAKSILIAEEGYQEGAARKFTRKIKDVLLALELEKNLSKKDILYLYLNQIYLGHHSYGVEAAAQNYFHKNVQQLNVAEMALLAGLPQAPSRYSPFVYPERAKARRSYVLRRMFEEGFITEAQMIEADKAEVNVFDVPDFFHDVAPYFAEHIRRELFENFSESDVLNGGLKVYASINLNFQNLADDAISKGVKQVDKRQGYLGPVGHAKPSQFETFLKKYVQSSLYEEPLAEEKAYLALVTKVDAKNKTVFVSVGNIKGVLPVSAMRWARKIRPERLYTGDQLEEIKGIFEVGDIIWVKKTTAKQISKTSGASKEFFQNNDNFFALEQEPRVQGALISIDPETNQVVAMVGGYNFEESEFNRAFQACRQPGSAFKPVVYTSAVDSLNLTPSTILVDSPIIYDDPDNENRWKPENYETKFRGDVPLRTAVMDSLNVPAIKVLQMVGIKVASSYAYQLGIKRKLNQNLSLALGSSCVTLWELSQVYNTLDRFGKSTPPSFIRKIIDHAGKLMYDNTHFSDIWSSWDSRLDGAVKALNLEEPQPISEQTAYLMTKLLQNVVQGGTAARAQELKRPAAGKTGTTNDNFDAWFMGFTPDLVTGVWVGYDSYDFPMGRYEVGGRASLPIWLEYMKAALQKKPEKRFRIPSGIVFSRIDPKTGLLARTESDTAVVEAYVKGSEPMTLSHPKNALPQNSFFKVDVGL